MPKKKQPNESRPKVDNPNVLGLHAAVVEQGITDTLESNYMPYAIPRHPGDRRLQALPPEAPLYDV